MNFFENAANRTQRNEPGIPPDLLIFVFAPRPFALTSNVHE